MKATVIGKNYTIKDDGTSISTLQVASEFPDYYGDASANRYCAGKMVESVYVGTYDCSDIAVGSEVDILYGKAIPMKNGGYFQPIEKINVVK